MMLRFESVASDESARFATTAQELVGLQSKVRVMDDEFSKRTKALESVV